MPQAPTTLQVTLSQEAFEFVQKKVASGEYASESELLNESLALLQDQKDELEHWLRTVGVPSFERIRLDPSLAIPIEEVERHLQEKRKLRNEKRA